MFSCFFKKPREKKLPLVAEVSLSEEKKIENLLAEYKRNGFSQCVAALRAHHPDMKDFIRDRKVAGAYHIPRMGTLPIKVEVEDEFIVEEKFITEDKAIPKKTLKRHSLLPAEQLQLPVAWLPVDMLEKPDQDTQIPESRKEVVRDADLKALSLIHDVASDKDRKSSSEWTGVERILFFDKQGSLYEKAAQDLRKISEVVKEEKIKIDLETVKEYFAQLVLGVEALHTQGLVHRDVARAANTLIFVRQYGSQKYLELRLCDLFAAAKFDDKTIISDGVNGLAPEVQAEKQAKIQAEQRGERATITYADLDKKAIDCNNLGWLFEHIAKELGFSSHPEIKALIKQLKPEDIETHLKPEDVAARLKISDLKKHPFFVETDQHYFDKVAAKLSRSVYYDGILQDGFNQFPKKEDAFLAHPKFIKEILMISDDIEDQWQFVQSCYPNNTKFCDALTF